MAHDAPNRRYKENHTIPNAYPGGRAGMTLPPLVIPEDFDSTGHTAAMMIPMTKGVTNLAMEGPQFCGPDAKCCWICDAKVSSDCICVCFCDLFTHTEYFGMIVGVTIPSDRRLLHISDEDSWLYPVRTRAFGGDTRSRCGAPICTLKVFNFLFRLESMPSYFPPTPTPLRRVRRLCLERSD